MPEAGMETGTSVIWKVVCLDTPSKTKGKGLEASGAVKVGVVALHTSH